LPFEHAGYGQDEEWVLASFTNAAEILNVGYNVWVDEQVGINLTNGLFKLTVTVPEKPLETTQLKVGDYSVAVTNAGDYVFLLEKGREYPLSVFPKTATNFLYEAVDDLGEKLTRNAINGYWTRDQGYLELIPPVHPYSMSYGLSGVKWNPSLFVSPETWQPSELNPEETFTAVLSDYPRWVEPHFSWHTSDADKIFIVSTNSVTTVIGCNYPQVKEGEVSLSLKVSLNQQCLYSYFNKEDDPDWNGGTWGSSNLAFRIAMPKTLFVNDDDDNDNGEADFNEKNARADDDEIFGEIKVDSSTKGSLKVDKLYGFSSPFVEMSGFYDDEGLDIIEGTSYDVSGLFTFTKFVKINPSACSQTYLGSGIKLRMIEESGAVKTGVSRFTVVEPIVEPICNQTTNVIVGGIERKLTINPCGVAIGENAYFRIEVNPSDFPDEQIVWTATDSNKVSFVGGNTGRCVTVCGREKGKTELLIQIGDAKSAKPSFTVNVVEKKEIDVRVWIIADGEDVSFKESDVLDMLKEANDIYAQVGVRFNLVEPIVVTNIQGAYKAYYDSNKVQGNHWTFNQIVNIATNTGGIECYFIDSFVDEDGTIAVNSGRGMVLTKKATGATFAHECGHLFGMRDVYVLIDDDNYLDENTLQVNASDKASYDKMLYDWNGGSAGKGMSGCRYYKYNTSMQSIINRMLMNGFNVSGKRDITSGDIYGVWYYINEEGEKVWSKSSAPVGWDFESKNKSFDFHHK
jgi:hypothetical protein